MQDDDPQDADPNRTPRCASPPVSLSRAVCSVSYIFANAARRVLREPRHLNFNLFRVDRRTVDVAPPHDAHVSRAVHRADRELLLDK